MPPIEPEWPHWPADVPGTKVLHVQIDLPVSKVFDMLHNGVTDFRAKRNEKLNYRSFTATPWHPGPGTTPSLAASAGSDQENVNSNASRGAGNAAGPLRLAALQRGFEYEASYSGTNSFGQYDCEEVFRLLDAEPGKRYTIEVCVATSAQYGDKFRALVRQELRAVPGDGGAVGERCDMYVKAVLVFIKDVNWALKKIIENAATNGMGDHFKTVAKVLREHAAVRDVSGLPRAPTLMPRSAGLPRRQSLLAGAAAEGAEAAAGGPRAATAAMEELVMSEGEEFGFGLPASKPPSPPPPLPTLLEKLAPGPLMDHLQLLVPKVQEAAGRVPALGRVVGRGVAQAVLCTLLMLCATQVIIWILRFLERASLERHAADPRDPVALLLSLIFKVVDVPDSAQEVFTSSLLLVVAWGLLNRLATRLPPPPRPVDPNRRIVRVPACRYDLKIQSVSVDGRSPGNSPGRPLAQDGDKYD